MNTCHSPEVAECRITGSRGSIYLPAQYPAPLPDLTNPLLRQLSEDLRGTAWEPLRSLERCDPDAPVPSATPRQIEVPEGCFIHRLQLRPGVFIEWPLPGDLSRRDVDRLLMFLEVLPVPTTDPPEASHG